jgi:hypothetical protein
MFCARATFLVDASPSRAESAIGMSGVDQLVTEGDRQDAQYD